MGRSSVEKHQIGIGMHKPSVRDDARMFLLQEHPPMCELGVRDRLQIFTLRHSRPPASRKISRNNLVPWTFL